MKRKRGRPPNPDKRKLIITSFRVADDLYALLQSAAVSHGQSMNAEINDRLRRSFERKP